MATVHSSAGLCNAWHTVVAADAEQLFSLCIKLRLIVPSGLPESADLPRQPRWASSGWAVVRDWRLGCSSWAWQGRRGMAGRACPEPCPASSLGSSNSRA